MGWLRQSERLTGVWRTPVPLPADFDEAMARLPRPAASPPKAQRRFEEAGGREATRRERPENEQQRRAFRHRRKPGGVGAFKGAVRKAGR